MISLELYLNINYSQKQHRIPLFVTIHLKYVRQMENPSPNLMKNRSR